MMYLLTLELRQKILKASSMIKEIVCPGIIRSSRNAGRKIM